MRRRETYHVIKLGTMPGNCVWVTVPKVGFSVGQIVQFRENISDRKRQEARIWKIGPPPEYRLYLEL